MEDQHVGGPAIVLAKAAALAVAVVTIGGDLLTSLTSGLRQLWNTAFGEARYRIGVQVVRDLTVTDLLSAPVPPMCTHPAGRLRNGLPGLGPTQGFEYIAAGQPDPYSGIINDKPVFTDVTGDGRQDAVTVAHCSAGGVGWPNVLLLYGSGPTLLGGLDLGDVYAAEHAEVGSLAVQGHDVVVTWQTYEGCCFDMRTWTGTLRWDGQQLRMTGAHQS